MIDITRELKFKTARSGGSGGQNVNKVETMAEGYFDIERSAMLTEEQKLVIRQKLSNKITSLGMLLVKSQTERSQLGNKEQVIIKMNKLINQALVKPKKRKPTKPSKAAKQKRIDSKKKKGEIKSTRKKVDF